MPLILGIDEAGRGAVVGPLVLCAAAVDEQHIAELERLATKDSKQLSPAQRQELAHMLRPLLARCEVVSLNPQDIDERGRAARSLNQLEIETCARLIRDIRPARAYIDLPQVIGQRSARALRQEAATGTLHSESETGPRRARVERTAFVTFLRQLLDFELELVVENLADEHYPVVAAASIIAKVERDAAIAELRRRYGDFGSGYPSDERTVRFLEEYLAAHGRLPSCARSTWRTARRLTSEQQGLDL